LPESWLTKSVIDILGMQIEFAEIENKSFHRYAIFESQLIV
jgi:hypothetical protein